MAEKCDHGDRRGLDSVISGHFLGGKLYIYIYYIILIPDFVGNLNLAQDTHAMPPTFLNSQLHPCNSLSQGQFAGVDGIMKSIGISVESAMKIALSYPIRLLGGITPYNKESTWYFESPMCARSEGIGWIIWYSLGLENSSDKLNRNYLWYNPLTQQKRSQYTSVNSI